MEGSLRRSETLLHTEWICPKVEERNRASGEGREIIVNQIFENTGTLKLQNL